MQAKVNHLEGVLHHIDRLDLHEKYKQFTGSMGSSEKDKIIRKLSKRERVLKDFFIYKNFFYDNTPTLICEGVTDPHHISSAIRILYKNQPDFFAFLPEEKCLVRKFRFFKWNGYTNRFFSTKGGTPDVKNIANRLKNTDKLSKKFKGLTVSKKIIYILDTDKSAKAARKNIQTIHGLEQTSNQLVLKKNNFYLVEISKDKDVEIEDLYPDSILSTEVDGKHLERDEVKMNNSLHYSKQVFVQKVIQGKNLKKDNFQGFTPLLYALSDIINDRI